MKMEARKVQLCSNSEEASVRAYIQKKLRNPLTHRVLQNFPPDSGHVPEQTDIHPWLENCRKEGRDVHIYIAIPFCTDKGVDKEQPEKCGFCLLPTVPYSEQALRLYMDVLLNRELPKYAEYMGRQTSIHQVDTVFLGGGTPNILSPTLYEALLDRIRNLFSLKHTVEITTEGTPELYTYEKLKRFRDIGGTRISLGVQQFNEDLLPICGRKVSKSRVRRAITAALELGFSVSVDLIYGWPDQTTGRFLSEIDEIVQIGVPRITAYPLNVNRSSYFSTVLRHRLPNLDSLREMYLKSRERLVSLGYTPITLNDYEKVNGDGCRPHCLRHEKAMRSDHLSYRIGLGYAAQSKLLFLRDGSGITYRNYSTREEGLNKYIASWQQGLFPIETHFIYSSYDLLLNYISGSLQTFRIDLNDMQRHFPDFDIEEEFGPVLAALKTMGWIRTGNGTVETTEEGRLFTHILQGAFFIKRIEELTNKVRKGGVQ